jgi:hypothetical protein
MGPATLGQHLPQGSSLPCAWNGSAFFVAGMISAAIVNAAMIEAATPMATSSGGQTPRLARAACKRPSRPGTTMIPSTRCHWRQSCNQGQRLVHALILTMACSLWHCDRGREAHQGFPPGRGVQPATTLNLRKPWPPGDDLRRLAQDGPRANGDWIGAARVRPTSLATRHRRLSSSPLRQRSGPGPCGSSKAAARRPRRPWRLPIRQASSGRRPAN